jgi:hypothetical protein
MEVGPLRATSFGRGNMKKKTLDAKHDDILTTTAKAIGSAAGKIASLAGVAEPARHSRKLAKLQKKNKPHLPRRMKKAQKKAAAQAKS